MQDKPIIINDIDVSECENALQGKHTILCAGSEDRALCDANTNCSYKKFKRKEQEYEELRQYHNKCCEEFEKEKKEWLEKYNQISRGFYNGDYCNTEWCSLLKAKEQECNKLYIQLKADEEYHKEEENTLRKIIENKEERNIELYKENNKLKQLKAENEDLKKQVNDLLNKPEIQDKILWKIDNEAVLGSKDAWIYKLEQTLTEIKEIAKIEYPKSLFTETFVEVINHCPYFDCGKCKCLENKETQNCGGFICSRKQSVYYQENTIYFKQILQKISEVLNEQ